MPGAAHILSRTLDIERQHLPLGKVVLEELVAINSLLVQWTSWTSLSVHVGRYYILSEAFQRVTDNTSSNSVMAADRK